MFVNPITHLISFIQETYPVKLYPKVLEVASGNGNLAIKLSQLGYQVTAMDPKTSNKILPKNVAIKGELFGDNTPISDYDLGIAVFPCGTSEKFIRNFVLNEKSFLLLPCVPNSCSLSSEFSDYSNVEEWISYLKGIDYRIERKNLFDNSQVMTRELGAFKNLLYLKK